jgi:hypothetical protein
MSFLYYRSSKLAMEEHINSPMESHIAEPVQKRLEEEKAHIVKGAVKEELLEGKRKYICSFCGAKGNSEVDDSDLVLCFRCLGIMQLHREALKLFLR